ncbi:hypothetical protein ENUP19_0018G0005 [Entamoeba nuttalli]|uniref:Uncharacterized protein n=1 Tax=Entamoeba nuttalli TaxID=412467 RepID=A0ABQ0D8I7_9EUKA
MSGYMPIIGYDQLGRPMYGTTVPACCPTVPVVTTTVPVYPPGCIVPADPYQVMYPTGYTPANYYGGF